MVTQKLAHCDWDYSTLVKNTPHLCALGPFHSDLASVLFNQILEADSQEAESHVACNPLLKTAETKTRRFVEFLREQSSSKGRTWGCSTTQGCNATEVAPWDHHLLGHRVLPIFLSCICVIAGTTLRGSETQSKPRFSDQGQCCGKEEAIWSALSWPFQILQKGL